MPLWFVRLVVAGVLALSSVALAADAPRRYDGCQVLRVEVTDASELALLEALDVDFWTDRPAVGPVDVLVTPEQRAAMEAFGLRSSVRIADVQALVDQQHAPQPRDWFDAYHPYDEIVAHLDQLVTTYPELAQLFPLGTTVEDRIIWGIRIAAPAQTPLRPGVFYWGTVHAREWITSTIIPYLATHLLANYGLDPVVTDLVNHVEFLLVPVANPDGYIYSWETERLWRKNRRDNGDGTFGVDINRNWGHEWGGDGSSGTPGANTYRGPVPFSEPETRALRDLFLDRPNVRAMNDIHSYSQLILWPWGWTPAPCPDQAAYAAAGDAMRQLILGVSGKNYTAGPANTTIYPVSGGSIDWTYGVRDVFSFTFELRDTGTYGFLLPPDQIRPTNLEILPTLLYLANRPEVRATQIRFPEGVPSRLVVGAATPIPVAVTSGVAEPDPATARVYVRYHPGEAFVARPLEHVAGALFCAVLPPTHCGAQPEFYFAVDVDGQTQTQPPDAPATVYTAAMVSGTTGIYEPLDTNPGWTTEGLWAWGIPLGGGGQHGGKDPRSGYTGAFVYGYNLAGDYTNNMPERNLTSIPYDCRGQWGLRLSFWRWLGVEQPPYDRAAVRVSRDGVNWTTLWQNTAEVADRQWVYQDFDISAVADNQPTVYLRWSMGPTDSGWVYCGWNIDDIRVYATGCAELRGDANCDGRVDFDDIDPFVVALGGQAAYEAAYPFCRWDNADCDNSGSVDFDDIDALVAALSGG